MFELVVFVRQGLVIPCYNEGRRLDVSAFNSLLSASPQILILLVDDGSKDNTRELLSAAAAKDTRIQTLFLERNQGKAEAVRRGLLHLVTLGCDVAGYADADFATPVNEIIRLLEACDTRREAVLGSRVRLLGTNIQRKAMRHYLGRVFATFASLTLKLGVYDTQCGSKFFRVTDELKQSLIEPFRTRWVFDVELIGRLTLRLPPARIAGIIEVPLQEWNDVGDSKLGTAQMLRAAMDLLRVAWHLRRARQRLH